MSYYPPASVVRKVNFGVSAVLSVIGRLVNANRNGIARFIYSREDASPENRWRCTEERSVGLEVLNREICNHNLN